MYNLCNKELSINIGSNNIYTIDAINPLLGHVKNNISLLCKNCNSRKGIRYIGTYDDKLLYRP